MRGWLAALEQGLAREDRSVIYGVLRDAVPDFGGEAARERPAFTACRARRCTSSQADERCAATASASKRHGESRRRDRSERQRRQRQIDREHARDDRGHREAAVGRALIEMGAMRLPERLAAGRARRSSVMVASAR